jgi:hypothetical protein
MANTVVSRYSEGVTAALVIRLIVVVLWAGEQSHGPHPLAMIAG